MEVPNLKPHDIHPFGQSSCCCTLRPEDTVLTDWIRTGPHEAHTPKKRWGTSCGTTIERKQKFLPGQQVTKSDRASLSFLGLGVQPPTASWGRDLNEARRYLEDAWWLVTFPTVMIALAVLNMNFIGDGLRDALDPRAQD